MAIILSPFAPIKKMFFGNLINGKMQLSRIGKIAQQYWSEIPQHSKYTYLDEYVIMPNHVHGIIIINNPNNPRRDIPWNVLMIDDEWDLSNTMSKLSPKSGLLSVIIRSYKSTKKTFAPMSNFKALAIAVFAGTAIAFRV